MKLCAIKGVKDILPDKTKNWNAIEIAARQVFTCFGFEEIKIPIIEKTELFVRSIGEATDIVEKEMYTFLDRGGDSITLRPEGTASVVRAFVEHKLYNKMPVTKLYYTGPMFRRERPQAGRFRQFYQIGAEAFGSQSPAMDADIIVMLCTFFERFNIGSLEVNINTLGCDDCRGNYKVALKNFLEKNDSTLCDDCKRRTIKNPLRVLDCKVKDCQKIIFRSPAPAAHICNSCNEHHEEVKDLLTAANISFKQNDLLVRGLDYYSKTAFEVIATSLGSQNAVAGGGRYDKLVEKFNGPKTPAVGFAIGVDRLASLLGDNFVSNNNKVMKGFFVALGPAAYKKSNEICCHLRRTGITIERSYDESSLKSQMRKANRFGAHYTLIFGEQELNNNCIIVKDMATSEQTTVDCSNLLNFIKKNYL